MTPGEIRRKAARICDWAAGPAEAVK